MSTYTVSWQEVIRKHRFRCPACGFEGPVTARGFGEATAGGWSPEAADVATGAAVARAARDLEKNLGILRCPRCRHRDAAAVRAWWGKRSLVAALLVLPLLALAAFPSILQAKPSGIPLLRVFLFGFAGAIALGSYLSNRVRWRRFAVDHHGDQIATALDRFMAHAKTCATCDLDQGRAGLCGEGRALYAAKERVDRPS